MIYRKRMHKKRYGLSSGRSFIGVHMGRRSWYMSKFPGKFPIDIHDDQGSIKIMRAENNGRI
jgi:hypothetical protein